MQIPKIALKNYQFVLILVVLVSFVGLSSLLNMPRNEDPNPNFPIYTIVAIYPGTSPEDMEELVVEPLEEAIDLIDEVERIETKIEEGLAILQVEAGFGVDVDDTYDEVLREVKNVEPELPQLYSLDVSKFEPNSRVKIQQLAIGAPGKSFAELRDLAEELETRLERLGGVDDAKIEACPDEIIKVTLDFQRMANFNIPLQQVVQVLQVQNLNIPSGDLAAGAQSLSIQSSGSYASLEQVRGAVVASADGFNVRLSDIAEVRFDYAEDNWIARVNGERCILLSITQKSGNNLVEVGAEINGVIDDYKASLPEEVIVASVFEQAPAVEARITDFFSNLLQGVLLVGLVVLLFLGGRASVIVMTVIPLSIVMAISVLDAYGYALQQISIAGLVIALGLLVDNGIVVVENIKRYLNMGLSPREAALKGTGEVGFAVISSTVTTVLAFFPLAMLNSGPGEFLRTLPLIVIFTLGASLLLALTFTPILSGKVMKSRPERKRSWIERKIDGLIDRFYAPLLRLSLRRGIVVLGLGILSLVGSFMLFPSIGVSFFPTADKPLMLIEVDAPRGSSLERTDRAIQYVTDLLDSIPQVSGYVSNTGHGNPMVYYNRVNEEYKKYHGQLLVNFEAWDPETFYPILDDLRYQFARYSDARITFSELKNGPPFEAPIAIKIIGEDLDTLKQLSFQLEEVIRETEGTLDVDNPFSIGKTDLEINIDRDKASLYGVSLAEIDQALRTGVDGLTVDRVSLGQEDYDLVVQTGASESRVTSLSKLFFTNQSGDQVPMSQLATVNFLPSISEILHFNRDRSTMVTANVLNPDATTAITESIMAKLENITLPEGYEFYIAGEYEEQQESFGDLGNLLLIALIGIFAVLVLQFRSIKQPLIVFAAIPLALTGSFVALFLTGWSFSFFAFVGFNSLIGIVVNNSIILVDYTNQLIRGGLSKQEAIMEAAKTRFTPILLTTLTTILGLLPLTVQGTNLWSPLGWTIIGGMISSTFLTLLIVPILYKWLSNEKQVATA